MNVEVEYTGPKVRMPTPATFLGEIDNQMRARAGVARDRTVQSMRAEIPSRSGRTAASTTGRVAATRGGYEIRVSNRVRGHILFFLERGTGVYGPRHRYIARGKRGFIRGLGRPPRGRGQRPQKTVSRMLAAPWRNVLPATIADMRAAWDQAVGRIGNR